MFLARFKTDKGAASLPIDRATLLEGLRLNGFNGTRTARAVKNLSRGVPVIVGECVVVRADDPRRWN